jgi:hypothetical protein
MRRCCGSLYIEAVQIYAGITTLFRLLSQSNYEGICSASSKDAESVRGRLAHLLEEQHAMSSAGIWGRKSF